MISWVQVSVLGDLAVVPVWLGRETGHNEGQETGYNVEAGRNAGNHFQVRSLKL